MPARSTGHASVQREGHDTGTTPGLGDGRRQAGGVPRAAPGPGGKWGGKGTRLRRDAR